MECYARVMDTDTRSREIADIKAKIASIEENAEFSLLDINSNVQRASIGGLGGSLMLIGMAGLLFSRRKFGTNVSGED